MNRAYRFFNYEEDYDKYYKCEVANIYLSKYIYLSHYQIVFLKY